METLLSKLDQLWDSYERGEMTYQEFVRFEQAAKADCPHQRLKVAHDEDDVLHSWCDDCGEDF